MPPGPNSALEPGGYLEFQEICAPFACDDDSMEGTQIERCGELFVEASVAMSRPMNAAPTYKHLMRKVGFEYGVERQLKWPIGPWAKDKHFKDVGHWCREILDIGLEGLLMALLTRGLGWSKEEVLVLCTLVRNEMKDPRIHAYVPM
ncbi:hypothetical protein IMZ48_46015 [Candidatus Bathyarchaeota archaeon]|nr:hypothetical protein [Candidatus Bathyarchaeota archaeon]